MSQILDSLITDRSYADIQEARTLIAAMQDGTFTTANVTAFQAGLRGCWNGKDMDRLERAIKYIVDILVSAGYTAAEDMKTLTNWESRVNAGTSAGNLVWTDATDWARVLQNMQIIKDCLGDKLLDSPPERLTILDYKTANALEQFLLEAGKEAMTEASPVWPYAGTGVYAGAVGYVIN